MHEQEIQYYMMSYLLKDRNHKIVAPNITNVYPWECDLLSVTATDLVHEFEIKISKSGYRADSKKRKHNIMNWGAANDIFQHSPNYFWYVISGFTLSVDDMRPRCGFIYITETEIKVITDAPRLHAGKLREDKFDKIARSLSYKVQNTYRFYLPQKLNPQLTSDCPPQPRECP